METFPNFNGGTVPEVIQHWAETYPDKEVFIFYRDAGRRSLTCGNLRLLVGKFASSLQSLGLRKGDIICSTLTNSVERIVTDFGILTAGCVAANAQALLTDGTDLLHVLNVSKCRLLLADPTLSGGAWDILKGHLGDVKNGRVQSSKVPSLERVVFVGVSKDQQFLEKLLEEDEPELVDINPKDRAVCWSTSGSTGFSKLVPHTHEHLLLSAEIYKSLFNVRLSDVLYSDRHMGWAGGWPYMFVSGCNAQVLTDSRGSVDDPCKLIWTAIGKEGCTISALAINVINSLQERNDLVKEPLLDTIIATGQPFRQYLLRLVGKLCKVVTSSYGLTEVGYITSALCTEKQHFLDNLAGCVTNTVDVRIVDDQLEEVATGKDGEILIKGPIVFTEYLNNPEATKAAFTEDGWLKTDDIGHIDAKGQLFVEGRRSEAIMHREFIIYPSWVEKTLSQCPYIDQVMVIGVPDDDVLYEICACVIPSDSSVTPEMLKDHCDRMFAGGSRQMISACPRYYVIVEEFPTRPTGKADRRSLAELAAKILCIT